MKTEVLVPAAAAATVTSVLVVKDVLRRRRIQTELPREFSLTTAPQERLKGFRVVPQDIPLKAFLNLVSQEDEALSLSQSTLTLAVCQREGCEEYFAFLNRLCGGSALNKILYAIATYKEYGEDTQDVVNDWGLMDKTDSYVSRLRASRLRKLHESLGQPWTIFEQQRPNIRYLIMRDLQPASITDIEDEPLLMMIPVIRWVKRGNERNFVYDLLDYKSLEPLILWYGENHPQIAQHIKEDWCFNPVVGIWCVAYFSPQIRSTWADRYSLVEGGPKRVMGPTQAPILPLSFSRQLSTCLFIQRKESFIDRNAIKL